MNAVVNKQKALEAFNAWGAERARDYSSLGWKQFRLAKSLKPSLEGVIKSELLPTVEDGQVKSELLDRAIQNLIAPAVALRLASDVIANSRAALTSMAFAVVWTTALPHAITAFLADAPGEGNSRDAPRLRAKNLNRSPFAPLHSLFHQKLRNLGALARPSFARNYHNVELTHLLQQVRLGAASH